MDNESKAYYSLENEKKIVEQKVEENLNSLPKDVRIAMKEAKEIIEGSDIKKEMDIKNRPKFFQRKIKKLKKFDRHVVVVIVSASVGASLLTGVITNKLTSKVVKEEAIKQERQLDELDANRIDSVYNLPDGIVLKYINDCMLKEEENSELYNKMNECLQNYYEFIDGRFSDKKMSEAYKKFKDLANQVSTKYSLGVWRYAIEKTPDGQIIDSPNYPKEIDNENNIIYLPANEKLDPHDMPEGFYLDGTYYVEYNNESSMKMTK